MRKKTKNRRCKYCRDDGQKPNAPHQLAVGSILKEQYLIGRAIGQGGFGITYIGWDFHHNSRIAVKEYFLSGVVVRDNTALLEVKCAGPDAYEHFASQKERFLREYKVLKGLSEIPGLVQVEDFFPANNTVYIVMEYIEGITLKQYVEKQGGRLSGRETFQILKPVLRSLEKIHNAGLVHRDISPDNLLILGDGSVKLLDFGAVREVNNYAVGKSLTRPTEALFKQGYTPLEQYQSKGSLGPWTDVYALCATACYCLTGEVPPEALERLMQETPVQFRKAGADISEYEEDVLQKGMELRVDDRIKDMKELYTALFDSNHKKNSQKAETQIVGKVKNTVFLKRRWILLLAIIMLFCAAAALGYRNMQLTGNKVIAVPLCFEDITSDDIYSNDKFIGTWFNLRCGTVEALSDTYAFCCSLYLPKHAFKTDSSRVWIDYRLDMDEEDYHIGTADGIYRLELIHEKDEIFLTSYDSYSDKPLQPQEQTVCYKLHDVGNYYKVEIKDFPYRSKMHNGDPSVLTAIDTGRGGSIALNMNISGIGQQLSSFVYLDDIVIKDDGKPIYSFDCSVESLYGYDYFYECERADGEKQTVHNPEIEKINAMMY